MKELPKNLNRLEKLVEIIKNEGKVNVSYLADFFNVTEMTIYNDLKKITDDKIILLGRLLLFLHYLFA